MQRDHTHSHTHTHRHTLCSAAGVVAVAPDDMIIPCGIPCTTDEEGAGKEDDDEDGGCGDPDPGPWLAPPPPAEPPPAELDEEPKPGKDGLLEMF